MQETITYYTASDLRASTAKDQETARTKFIEESGADLIGGFYHGAKGDEWIVRRIGTDEYVVTGSDFERRYCDGLVYDTHLTPRVMAAYEDGLRAKIAALGGGPNDDLAKSLVTNGMRDARVRGLVPSNPRTRGS